jgi:hypothetical protein
LMVISTAWRPRGKWLFAPITFLSRTQRHSFFFFFGVAADDDAEKNFGNPSRS